MEKEFVTYETALVLKELGFDEMCFAFYRSPIIELMRCRNSEPWMGNATVAAPLKQQVFRWFRDKYFLDCEIYVQEERGHKFYHYLVLQLVRGNIEWKSKNTTRFKIYEEAESACIYKLIELTKTK
jgi:hypothetical protein